MIPNDLKWLEVHTSPEQFLLFLDAFRALENIMGPAVYETADHAHMNVDHVGANTVVDGLRADVLELSFVAAKQLGVNLNPEIGNNDQKKINAILETLVVLDSWEDYFGLKQIIDQPLNKEALFCAVVQEIALVPAEEISQVIDSVKDDLPGAIATIVNRKIQEYNLSLDGIPKWVAGATHEIKKLADGLSSVFSKPLVGIFKYVQEGGDLGKPLQTYADMFGAEVIKEPNPAIHAYHWLAMHLATGLPKDTYYEKLATVFDQQYHQIAVTSKIVKTLKTLAS